MSTAIWVVIAVAVLIVVAAVGVFAFEQARTQRLRRRFGPEYDRAVEQSGDRRSAEKDLLGREQRHHELDLKELEPADRERYRREWTGLQEHFVDTPEAAVADADRLVTQVMRDRGYPTENFEDRVSLLSVEHGRTLDHYHRAHAISDRASHKEAGTEDLRQAMVHYRALFEDLLAVPENERSQVPDAAPEPVPAAREAEADRVRETVRDEPVIRDTPAEPVTTADPVLDDRTDDRIDADPVDADAVRRPDEPVEAAADRAPEHPAREGFHDERS
jgi:hypothetical protein